MSVINERLDRLSTTVNSKLHSVIEEYTINRTDQGREISLLVEMYIGILDSPLTNNDTEELTKALIYIRAHICQNHKRQVAFYKITELYNLINYLVNEKIITKITALPEKPNSKETYETYKTQSIPLEFRQRIKEKNIKANEQFYQTLSKTCSVKIAERLKEHVYNFKNAKHHRAPLESFLNFAFEQDPNWYENQSIIESSLLKFRNNLLNVYCRNSAYGQFQNVKNSIMVLREHNLIPKSTELPDNLRRCTNTQKVRVNNPLLCKTYIYDDQKAASFRSTTDFIKELTCDLDQNLKILITEARKIVSEGYKKFHDRNRIIESSEINQFIKESDLRIEKTTYLRNNVAINIKSNPFSREGMSSNLRTSNLVAYFEHFYESFITGKNKHNLVGIRLNKEVQSYLGLTASVASAMQLIIVEELGINPYSLYNIKIFSDGHGHEFVQLTDKGSVRLRALKLRARNVQTRNAEGSLTALIDISEQDINAAACLKMAIEMTSRPRKFTNRNELWLCATSSGIIHPKPGTFQIEFRKNLSKINFKNTDLKEATLKKIRTSKGVLIYLTSNGDSLKTANYLGNSVKTTLARYIPEYLTELVFRVKIRSFHNIILFMAVAGNECPAESLGLTFESFSNQVKQAFNHPDMGGELYQSLKPKEPENHSEKIKYFCVSLNNIVLALKYAKSGEDIELKADCKAAISKISEGPIVMKILLRQAEKLIA